MDDAETADDTTSAQQSIAKPKPYYKTIKDALDEVGVTRR